jgi:hypothetical protein
MNHVGFFLLLARVDIGWPTFLKLPSSVMVHKLRLFAVDSSGSSNCTFTNPTLAAMIEYPERHLFSYRTMSTRDGNMGAWRNCASFSNCGFLPYFCLWNRAWTSTARLRIRRNLRRRQRRASLHIPWTAVQSAQMVTHCNLGTKSER